MFILQNNNRGGYNVGDKTDKAAGNNPANQYQMVKVLLIFIFEFNTEIIMIWNLIVDLSAYEA